MLHNATKTQIDERVKAIRLSPKHLARLAKVDPMTVYRGPKRVVSRDAVVQALVDEELRILRHLIKLHGVPEAERDAA